MKPCFDFDAAPFPIREDLGRAFRTYWRRLAAAGNWWTGEERVAIAAESRRAFECAICQQRKQALSPGLDDGGHTASGPLSAAAVDAVHRVLTDPARITQAYLDASELSPEAYVELVGVAVIVLSIDEFARGLGLDLEPLPAPEVGRPTEYRPAQAERGVGFVPMIPDAGAVGAESDLWKVGDTANVLRALSLVPNAIREWYGVADAQYLNQEQMANLSGPTGRALDRRQMELVAGRVSAVNECFY